MERKHIFGDAGRISTDSFFTEIREGNCFYVDKTAFIEHFLSAAAKVSIVCRPRRFGKSLNMDTLRCFLTDREDSRGLFEGLAVERSRVWGMANSAPVFCFDFKGLTADHYRRQIFKLIDGYLADYADRMASPVLKRAVAAYLGGDDDVADGILLLTKVAFEAGGMKSYVLIDEYDKLLIDKAGADRYPEIREFMTYLFSAAFKGNPYLEKGNDMEAIHKIRRRDKRRLFKARAAFQRRCGARRV